MSLVVCHGKDQEWTVPILERSGVKCVHKMVEVGVSPSRGGVFFCSCFIRSSILSFMSAINIYRISGHLQDVLSYFFSYYNSLKLIFLSGTFVKKFI